MPMTLAYKVNVTGLANVLLRENFESFPSGWTQNIAANQAKVASPVHGGTYSAQFLYSYTGVGDQNVYAVRVLPSGTSDIHARFYIYNKTPEADETSNLTVQRKTIWFSDSTTVTDINGNHHFRLDWWNNLGGVVSTLYNQLEWGVAGTGGVGGVCGLPTTQLYLHVDDPAYALYYDRWYCVEVEVKMNTPGSSDGEVHVWLDGVAYYSITGQNLRGNCTSGYNMVVIGMQSNITTTATVHRYSYFDDLIVTDGQYIGV